MLHHVELYVADLEKSRLFWSELLEGLSYELYQTWNEGFSYKFGETYLVFVQAEEPFLVEGYHRKRVGLNHLAFHGGTKERIDEFRTKLKAKGIRLLYEDRYPFAGGKNHYAVFFEDPDGMKVEICTEVTA
ncbi:VOC family protein [Listeria marthii]|uniref:VOC family protein n=1 Tax=Listeria marthii TaxID=529731 RepID=UPI0018875CF0|nr:VOC family protein [Listeria marthii]MBF2398799.1 VOC family protein [Listeria marthii]